MYEATQTDIDSQLVRIPTDALWVDLLSQQADPQGRYTDAVDELLIKLQKARRCRHG